MIQLNKTQGLLNREELQENLLQIRSKTSPKIQEEAALFVISRLIPNHTHLFAVEISNDHIKKSRYFELIKYPNISTVLIRASDGVSACKGFYHYIKYKLKCHISWTETRIVIPNVLPEINMRSESLSSFIYHQNVCTWGYSFVWWTWHDWRRHIDWMALMGISMSIAPIQEEIWTRVYKNFGLTKEEIDNHLAGPAFLPWLRMGNIRGWGGPLSNNFKLQQMKLQKKIIKACRDLGITIAIPGFDGHLPKAMKRIFPNTTLTPVNCWNKFTEQYCCPLFLDPEEQQFKIIGEAFLKEIVKEYGTDHLYFVDPFNEVEPRLPSPEYLSKSAINIYETIKAVDNMGIWLLQGWMFVENPFWSKELIKSFLTAVPQGKIIVLDLMSEQFPQYERTESYYGQPFIWCMLHNFGGTLGMHGSLNIVNTRIGITINMENSTMIGVGITPEGINQNYGIYEFALERGWEHKDFNVKDWFYKYIEARYGIKDEYLENAWEIVLRTVYSYRGLIKLHGKYTITRRPSLKIEPYSWYDPEDFKNSLKFMLEANSSVYNNPLYQYDLVDITRQFLQLVADKLYFKLKESYKTKNLTSLEETIQSMIICFNDLENILASNKGFLLGNWLSSAKNIATTELESEIYELNARNQITLWGPNGQISDYAGKQWSGIAKDYFLPRWKLFFSELKKAIKRGKNFSEGRFKKKVLREVEHPFTVSKKIYSTTAQGNTTKIARDIWNFWNNLTLTKSDTSW
ncbi:alpha-N-acetylglucosaminidase [Condylostylus longicornis]|uniref:alpha-N-acetylglucosaminidase n=1 Tax=Condylostylus longicornis TaxID=2530218 RepID=UPI00244DE1D6|nr:alpha-N-acetylglucosaminidase [Condylostylus longicornis]